MFCRQKFGNTCSTKALRDYFALPESQPTPATLWSDNDNHDGEGDDGGEDDVNG